MSVSSDGVETSILDEMLRRETETRKLISRPAGGTKKRILSPVKGGTTRKDEYIMTKKIFGLLLAVALVLGLSVSAFADGTGSITITPPDDVDTTETITYTIYKVFDADGNGTNISYKLVEGKTSAPAGFTVDAAGNVTYTGASTNGELTAADIAAIAAYVTGDTPVTTATSTGGANAVARDLPNGYYYITTTTGSVVTINTTNPNATVEDENIVPSVDKTIHDASSYDEDGKKALAQVGTQVEYTATVTVGKGQINYVFEDTLGTGLEYVANSLTVADMTVDTDYTLTVEGQKITVEFKNDSIKNLAQGTEIEISYKATVTSDALQDNPAKNTATISYGEDHKYTSEPSEVKVYNAQISVIKHDGEGAPLAGAGFVLKNAEDKYYKLDNGVVTWVDAADADEHVSGTDGNVAAFTGLANGAYTLIENTTPAGYNRAADVSFTIAEGNYEASNLKQSATVVNNPGSVLPSTGGIGTTIFYILGAILVIGAGVVLVTRRRVGEQ